MRILITGSNGFVGSRAMKVLKNDHQVMGVDIDTVDLRNFTEIKTVFEEFKPEFVLHCAANGNIEECDKDHNMAIRTNVIATRNIASLCAQYDSGIVLCSTDHVYRFGEVPDDLHEYNETKGASYYGFTKVLCEREVLTKVKKHFIARLCWQYGLIEKDMCQDIKRVGIIDLIYLAYKNNTQITVPKGARHYVSNVYDTIDVFKSMMEGNLPFGIYNVASENDLTLKELYELVFKKMGLDSTAISKIVKEREEGKYTLTPEPFYLKNCGYKMPTFKEGLDRYFKDVFPNII